MSQPDLIAQLREARPVAPPELHERVRLIAVEAGVPPRRRVTWRRAFVVLVPVAAAAVLAAVMLPRGGNPTTTAMTTTTGTELAPLPAERSDVAKGLDSSGFGLKPRSTDNTAAVPLVVPQVPEAIVPGAALKASTPPPSDSRAQKYSATLSLRLPSPNAVSKATTRALDIAASLGGYPQVVRVNAGGKAGAAYIVLKVPRNRVQDAVRRLGALGTIVGENVKIADLQGGVDQKERRIARLQAKLTDLRALPQTDELAAQIATLTAQVERLQRARAATIGAAQYATVELRLGTPPAPVATEEEDGPLAGLGTAFRWIGIGAVYALALGAPVIALVALGFLLARTARRRREDRLLASQ